MRLPSGEVVWGRAGDSWQARFEAESQANRPPSRATSSWVRIPLPPPVSCLMSLSRPVWATHFSLLVHHLS